MNNINIFGDKSSKNWVFQMVDEHDLKVIDHEYECIKKEVDEFCLITIKVEDWNNDLSPWEAPPVFGKEGFGGESKKTLDKLYKIIEELDPQDKYLYLAGYSLAGLFALWTAYQTDLFSGYVGASPSVWFPHWLDYVKDKKISKPVYLSLGTKEEKVRNKTMAQVGDNIREYYNILSKQTKCILEWNPGNHFIDSDIRMAKGIIWLLRKGE